MEAPKNLKELIEAGYAFPAMLPEKNDFLLTDEGKRYREKAIANGLSLDSLRDIKYIEPQRLDNLKGYFAFLTAQDYGAASPVMWNTLFERNGLNLRALFFVGNPKDAEIIIGGLKADPRCLGGGLGSGWKEQQRYLDRVNPPYLKSVNSFGRDIKTGELIGYNTDIAGLLLPLENKLHEMGKGLEGRTVVMLGGGGVGKELPGGLIERGVGRVVILNRTVDKAKEMAEDANRIKEGIAVYGSELDVRHYLLEEKADVFINVSHKGAEPLQDYSALAPAETEKPEGVEENNRISYEISRELAIENQGIVLYDITLPQRGVPKMLEIAEKAGLRNLVHGTGMVVNQGVIAIQNISNINPGVFGSISKEEVVRIFSEAMRR